MSKRGQGWPPEEEWIENVYHGALQQAAARMARLTFLVGTYYPEVFDADFARIAAYIKQRRERRACIQTTTQSHATSAVAI